MTAEAQEYSRQLALDSIITKTRKIKNETVVSKKIRNEIKLLKKENQKCEN